jgi:hypothetical protein
LRGEKFCSAHNEKTLERNREKAKKKYEATRVRRPLKQAPTLVGAGETASAVQRLDEAEVERRVKERLDQLEASKIKAMQEQPTQTEQSPKPSAPETATPTTSSILSREDMPTDPDAAEEPDINKRLQQITEYTREILVNKNVLRSVFEAGLAMGQGKRSVSYIEDKYLDAVSPHVVNWVVKNRVPVQIIRKTDEMGYTTGDWIMKVRRMQEKIDESTSTELVKLSEPEASKL